MSYFNGARVSERRVIEWSVLHVRRSDDVSLDDFLSYHCVSYHSVVVSDCMQYTGKVVSQWNGLVGVSRTSDTFYLRLLKV